MEVLWQYYSSIIAVLLPNQSIVCPRTSLMVIGSTSSFNFMKNNS